MNKKIIGGLVLAGLFIIIQLIPSKRPEVIQKNTNDLLVNNEVDQQVEVLLRNSCYDCHSMETNYPWYSYVAPTKWLVNRDTKVGREALNFSNWEEFSVMDKIKYLTEIAEEIEHDEMPMKIYTTIHRDAVVTVEEKERIAQWIEEFGESLFN